MLVGFSAAERPDCFADLNLDQVVHAVAGDDAVVAGYFHAGVRDVRDVEARQAVFRDLDDPAVAEPVRRFTATAARTRRRLGMLRRMTHQPQAGWWFVDVVLDWSAAVVALSRGLDAAGSAGLRGLRADLAEWVGHGEFPAVRERAADLLRRLGEVRYDLLLKQDRVTVAEHDPTSPGDFADRVLATFARFRRDPAEPPQPPPDLGLDEVEAAVLDLVARLHPELFADLAAFHDRHRDLPDLLPPDLDRLDAELRFHLAYLDHLAPLRAAGIPTCFPRVSATDKAFLARGAVDLALAAQLVERGQPVVGNDLELSGAERVLVVSGPNQGGKTTLSRTFGQLYHLAALGCPVPGHEVRLSLADRVFTHYPRAESSDSVASKLEEELVRMRDILDRATPRSVVVLNEVFTSTTGDDARALSLTVLDALTRLDVPCLWVSFLDELSRAGPTTVSMVSTLDDHGARTYRVVRKPADGYADAVAVAEKHGLTRARILARVRR
ncbi:MutS domain protein, family 5 [Actinokineospora spheciospongiae]|uniref:MutS domain protein, family 5 n=1 Tax=Actinokineospora spheciospongiae TaxID=909613 RepID=W7IST4_9PSEU|nr:MutS domain protein, family 5 [Actinokineospora spheciospongiae]